MKTRFRILLSIALMLPILAGCVYDSDQPCDSDEVTIQLRLTMPFSLSNSRAADCDDLLPGTEAENYINFSDDDYQIVLIDSKGVVAVVLDHEDCKLVEILGDRYNSYILTTHINLSKIDADLNKFKVMALANWRSFERTNGNSSFSYPALVGYSTVKEAEKCLYTETGKFNFKFKDASKDVNFDPWIPSITNSRLIPMFGITDELNMEFVVAMSKDGDLPSFTIQMLRAIAKVEVTDELGDMISNVNLSAVNNSGRIIPNIFDNPYWDDEDIQIVTPTLPTNAGSVDGVFENLEFVQMPGDASKWVAYVPEMDLSVARPNLLISSPSKEVEPAPFDNYGTDGNVTTNPNGHLDAILRNHIYRFNVTIKDDTGVQIHTSVLPWTMEYDDVTWHFDDPKGYYMPFPTGSENAPYIADYENFCFILKEGASDDTYGGAGFHLVAYEPVGCRWFAQLIYLYGAADAFRLTGDSEGIVGRNYMNNIYVNTTSEYAYNRDNAVALAFFVEYPDGTVKELPIINDENNKPILDENGNPKRFTFIQKQNGDIY